jgi:hypothetical protein
MSMIIATAFGLAGVTAWLLRFPALTDGITR